MPVDCHFLLSLLVIRWVSPGGNCLSLSTLVLELSDDVIQGKPDNFKENFKASQSWMSKSNSNFVLLHHLLSNARVIKKCGFVSFQLFLDAS